MTDGRWRHEAGVGPDIVLAFEAEHRLSSIVTFADRVMKTLNVVGADWTWVVRDDRIDITLPDEDGKSLFYQKVEIVHADCRITLQARPRAFVLSDCRQTARVLDLSGRWLRQRSDQR